MYERNAIILERYFDEKFGYNLKNNIKINFKNYCELVEIQEKYKNITEEEEETIIDYDLIANKIRDIQKEEQNLNQEFSNLQQKREQVFENIDEDTKSIQERLDEINQNIQDIDMRIRENSTKFVNAVAEFSEKSLTRSKCGKTRRDIEFEYNNMLNETLDNYRNININIEQKAKKFIEEDTAEVEEELKNIIQENGKKERIPFNNEAIEQAIKLSIDIQKREAEIMTNSYEKTNKLFAEIKSGRLKIDLHKKIITDSKAKQEFILAIKEYLVQFLDNERLASVNGEKEYNQLMKDACKNLKDDLAQIGNLYTLLIKEMTKKATKKMYNELYKIEYLEELKNKSEDFEKQVKKLKLSVTIINPNHWRTEGMEKIYDIFNKCVTEIYNRDLSEFIPISAEDDEDGNTSTDENNIEKNQKEHIQKNINKINTEKKQNEKKEFNDEENEELDNVKSEIDRKIDLILGLNKSDNLSNFDEADSTEIYDDNYNELEDFKDDEESESFEEFEKNDEEYDVNEGEEHDEEANEDYDTDEDEEWDEDDETEHADNSSEEDDDYEEEDSEEDDEYDNEDEQWDEEDDEIESQKGVWKEADDVDFIWDVNDEAENDYEEEVNQSYNKKSKNKEEKDTDEEDIVDYKLQNIDNEDIDYDIWGNNINKKNKEEKNKKNNGKKNKNDNKKASDWGDEFVNIEPIQKKKKGFFNKFKK